MAKYTLQEIKDAAKILKIELTEKEIQEILNDLNEIEETTI